MQVASAQCWACTTCAPRREGSAVARRGTPTLGTSSSLERQFKLLTLNGRYPYPLLSRELWPGYQCPPPVAEHSRAWELTHNGCVDDRGAPLACLLRHLYSLVQHVSTAGVQHGWALVNWFPKPALAQRSEPMEESCSQRAPPGSCSAMAPLTRINVTCGSHSCAKHTRPALSHAPYGLLPCAVVAAACRVAQYACTGRRRTVHLQDVSYLSITTLTASWSFPPSVVNL